MPTRPLRPHARPRSRPLIAAGVAAALAACLVGGLSLPAPASAACTNGTHVITGAFIGEDGRSVSGFVGLSVLDAAGQNIGLDGCPIQLAGYGPFVDLVNPSPANPGCCFALPTEGAASGGERTWSIAVPNNAAAAWVEAYPKSSTPNEQGQAHQTDYRRYGGVLRRGVSAASGAHLDVRLPLNCESGGGAPTVIGYANRGGGPAQIQSVVAFSRAAEGTGQTLGFGTTPIAPNGPSFELRSLAPNQTYALEITTTDGGHWWFENDYGAGLPVRSCAGSPVYAGFVLPGSGFGGDRAILTSLSGPVASGPGGASTGPANVSQVFWRGADGSLMTMTDNSRASYSLGGVLLDEPDAVLTEPGRIDVVARGADSQIFLRTYNGAWGGWVPLGGYTPYAPSITSWAPGWLQIAATGLDGQLWQRTSADGGRTWFPWTPLGGQLSAGPDITSWGYGRVDVVARGTNGGVYQMYFANQAWSSWVGLGGYTLGGPSATSPTVGVLDVVARGGDSGVWMMRYDATGPTPWFSLGGITDAEPDVFSISGWTHIFARGVDGGIWRNTRTSPSGGFGGWTNVR